MKKLFLSLLLCLITASAIVAQSPVPGSNAERIVTAGQVNGTWQYGGKYRNNIFRIWALGQQKLKVEFVGTYQYKNPLGMQDSSGSGIARIEGDTAIFRPDNTELDPDQECKVTMQFSKGKLIVEQEGPCFGVNVIASGTYRRVSRAKPKFGEFAP